MEFEGRLFLQIIKSEKTQLIILYMIYNFSLSYLLERHPVLILGVKVRKNVQSPGIHTVSGKLPSLLKHIFFIFSSD